MTNAEPARRPVTLTDAAAALRAGAVTAVALTEASIAAADALDDRVGAYLARFDDGALERAAEADAELARGKDRGPLHGIPFAIKDIIAAAEGPTTAQSLVHDRAWGAGRDAPVVARLRAAGAVITGKTTTMEFACGSPDPSKPFPVPRNPWDLERWSGGSSSGTGGGLAAGMFLAGLGTDTLGSIRIPAAFCGVTGLMPTFGRVPKSGCVPLGYSLDRIGPMARSARDCAVVLAAIAGEHASDPDSTGGPFTAVEPPGDLAGLRVGVLRDTLSVPGADPAVAPAFEAAVAVLAGLGAHVEDVVAPLWREAVTAGLVTTGSEGLAYHRNDLADRWDDYFAASQTLLSIGAQVTGADYVQAQRVRRVARDALLERFATIDVMVSPTSSIAPPPVAAFGDYAGASDFINEIAVMHTAYWNAVGHPAIAVPMGFTDDGLPLSLQLAGAPFAEATILRAAEAFQQRTDWHLCTPALLAEGASR